MYLIRNKRTKDFIDNNGDWTMIRSFAKKFDSKNEAQKFIDKNQIKGDELYMEIVSENVQKHLKEYLAESTSNEKFDKKTIDKIRKFLEDYCTKVYSDAAMKYAEKYASEPDEIEEYLDYFDDDVYIKYEDLIKDIKKKLNITLDKNDRKEIEKIMDKADVGGVKIRK